MLTEEFKKTFTKFVTDHESEKLKIYDDGFGVPTIGIGFALINKISDGWKAYSQEELQKKGINLTAEQHNIIEDYAKAKTNRDDTSNLRSKLNNLDVTITLETSQNLLSSIIGEKYQHIKQHIGEDKWDKLNLAQQVGVMDHAFQRGNILSLKESLVTGNYDKTAEIMREIPNNSQATNSPVIKNRSELRSDLVKYGTMEFPGIHIVKPGDTASSIAKSSGITLKELAKLNPHLGDPNKISVGQKINIASNIERDGTASISSASANNVGDGSTDAAQLEEMLMLLVLTEQKKRLDKLVEKVETSLTEYESKANEILKDFINNKGKNLGDNDTSSVNQANAEIQQIAASIETKNASLFAEKQAELDAESRARFAAARATPTYSAIPTTITVSNADIAARKQAEYNSLMEGYKAECENRIAAIKARYETQSNKRKQSVESEISDKVNIVNQQKETYTKELISKVEEVKAKLIQGADVDVDSIINSIDIITSTNLGNIQNTVNQTITIAHAVIDIVYDNPVLNHPELIEQMASKFSSGIIDTFIDFGMQFINNAEDRAMLECVCNKPNNAETIALLMGLDIPDNIT